MFDVPSNVSVRSFRPTFKTPYQVFLEETGINARQLEVVRL